MHALSAIVVEGVRSIFRAAIVNFFLQQQPSELATRDDEERLTSVAN